MFELLFQGPLGYDIWQIGLSACPAQAGRQQDYADRTLEGQGIKLAVVEIKRYQAFERFEELDSALIQAARYADRHCTPNLIAFDGDNLVLALRRRLMDDIAIVLWEELGLEEEPSANLFYFAHFGLFRCPKEERRIIPYDAEEDEELYKTHHGEKLHYSCFAHVGDLRSKSTWKLPYRQADGSIDEKRLGHAVNYLQVGTVAIWPMTTRRSTRERGSWPP